MDMQFDFSLRTTIRTSLEDVVQRAHDSNFPQQCEKLRTNTVTQRVETNSFQCYFCLP